MARPDVGKPTICAPKSRRLIDAWRRGSTKTQSRSFSPRNAPENVWDDLYHHAFEPALCRLAPSDRKDDAELTFEPKIDEHSKAIVREKAVVDAILQVNFHCIFRFFFVFTLFFHLLVNWQHFKASLSLLSKLYCHYLEKYFVKCHLCLQTIFQLKSISQL